MNFIVEKRGYQILKQHNVIVVKISRKFPESVTLQLSRAVRRRLELRVGRLVPKRGNVGVLQKRSCVVWLLCYSNCIDNVTGETK